MTALALFASTFALVFALGLQSLNVNGGHRVAAFLTSFAIGASNLVLYKLAPDAGGIEIAAYLLGGLVFRSFVAEPAPPPRPGNKTSKDKAADLRRVNVSLDPASIEDLRAYGDGELSLGIRRAAKLLPPRV